MILQAHHPRNCYWNKNSFNMFLQKNMQKYFLTKINSEDVNEKNHQPFNKHSMNLAFTFLDY